ncbi:unnamed protein product [Ixodes hexagonus]
MLSDLAGPRNWAFETEGCCPGRSGKPYPIPMTHIRKEFQQASGTVAPIYTIRKKAHLLAAYHGRAAAHSPLITKSNSAARPTWCKDRRQWTSGNRCSGASNQGSPSTVRMAGSGFGVCRENASCRTVLCQQ